MKQPQTGNFFIFGHAMSNLSTRIYFQSTRCRRHALFSVGPPRRPSGPSGPTSATSACSCGQRGSVELWADLWGVDSLRRFRSSNLFWCVALKRHLGDLPSVSFSDVCYPSSLCIFLAGVKSDHSPTDSATTICSSWTSGNCHWWFCRASVRVTKMQSEISGDIMKKTSVGPR